MLSPAWGWPVLIVLFLGGGALASHSFRLVHRPYFYFRSSDILCPYIFRWLHRWIRRVQSQNKGLEGQGSAAAPRVLEGIACAQRMTCHSLLDYFSLFGLQ
jgi:hypothetical protein